MCGIVGLLLADQKANATAEICEALGILQHRGQDAAGIITCGERGRLFQRKGNGMVRDIFTADTVRSLPGYMGVSHVRYPTAGSSSTSEAQPFYVNSPYGISLAHNGNLTNAPALRDFLDTVAHRHINTDSDSELLLNILADNLQRTGKARIDEDDLFNAIEKLHDQVKGGYACVAMLAGFGLIAFRDPNGIRPICYGRRVNPDGSADWMVASESVCLENLEYTDITDIGPGEAIIITKSGHFSRRSLVSPPRPFTPCIFEYVYFARPDSIMDGVSVYKARLAMGELLARRVLQKLGRPATANDPPASPTLGPSVLDDFPPLPGAVTPNGRAVNGTGVRLVTDIDVVIPVPDTSRVAAMQAARVLGLPFREGLMKNRYVARTFIMGNQALRTKSVRRKLNPMPLEFGGKVVLLVDDSIVRGTTSKEIVQMARDAGARKVYFASCAPPVKYPNVYGIDMPTKAELVAAHAKDEDEVAHIIGADEMVYQTLDDLEASIRRFNPALKEFDTSVFTGCYVTGDIDDEYLRQLEQARSDAAKRRREENGGIMRRKAGTRADEDGPVFGFGDTAGRKGPEQQVGLHNQLHD